MTHAIRTVLWFNGRGREAAEFYCSLIPNSRIDGLFVSDKGGPEGDMHFEVIDLQLNGVPFQLLDAGPMFPLTEARRRTRPRPTGCGARWSMAGEVMAPAAG